MSYTVWINRVTQTLLHDFEIAVVYVLQVSASE